LDATRSTCNNGGEAKSRYSFNVYSEKKRLEKLDYMHHNPLKRGLVKGPRDWPWSSWRFYFLEDGSILEMDRLG
jgi:putative transposase